MPSIQVMVPVCPHRRGLAGPLLPELRDALQRRGAEGREVLLQLLRDGHVVVLQEGRGTWSQGLMSCWVYGARIWGNINRCYIYI